MRGEYVLAFLFALFAISILASPSYAEIDPETIVAFWSFDEGAGETAKDSSENKLDGELVGGPIWVDGKVAKALEFDGSDDYSLTIEPAFEGFLQRIASLQSQEPFCLLLRQDIVGDRIHVKHRHQVCSAVLTPPQIKIHTCRMSQICDRFPLLFIATSVFTHDFILTPFLNSLAL